MKIFQNIDDLQDFLSEVRQKGQSIGFVPTMGALHEGHISLIKRAISENDLVVCSIFVNPIQFNKKDDLDNYPRTLEADSQKLQQAGCDVIFNPSVGEMYPEPDNRQFDFGKLGDVMEGKFRPGHFNGVGIVVSKFFDIVQPDKAYFGQKDFQQLAIIKRLVEITNSSVQIISCPTYREPSGLAMSSRNMRLSADEQQEAAIIYYSLNKAKEMAQGGLPLPAIRDRVKSLIKVSPSLDLEYFEIVDAKTLMPIQEWGEAETIVACIAVWLDEVRLIDNMILLGEL